MADMNIRAVDGGLLQAFKDRAAVEGMTLRAWVLASLRVTLDECGVVAPVAEVPTVAQVRQRPQAEESPVTCRRCDRPTPRDPKNPAMWYCYGCKRQLDEREVRQ